MMTARNAQEGLVFYQNKGMELLQKLQACNNRTLSFKQAFSQLGMTEIGKHLKELTEKEELQGWQTGS